MKLFIFILLFSISLSAQTKKDVKPVNIVYTTTIDGKSTSGGALELTNNQISNITIGLQYDHDKNQEIPKISALELFVPGHPAIYIKGDKLDEDVKSKINGLKKGDKFIIRPIIDNNTSGGAYPPKAAVAEITVAG